MNRKRLKKLLVLAIMVCLAVLACFLLYKVALLRWLLLAAIAAVLLWKLGTKAWHKVSSFVEGRLVKAIKGEAPTSFFQDLSWRNAEKLVVGSTSMWKYVKVRENQRKVYALSFYRCALAMQVAVLKCYFGHVRKGGVVALAVEPSEYEALRGHVSPVDAVVVHELYFMAEGGGLSEAQRARPLRYFPSYTISFALNKLLKKRGAFAGKTWRKQRKALDAASLKEMAATFESIAEYCAIRELSFEVYLVGSDPNVTQALSGTTWKTVACADASSLEHAIYG